MSSKILCIAVILLIISTTAFAKNRHIVFKEQPDIYSLCLEKEPCQCWVKKYGSTSTIRVVNSVCDGYFQAMGLDKKPQHKE